MGVEQWRSAVEQELDRARLPLPAELVLAVMKRESNGRVGVKNPRSGASGLMQVMPIALKHYNQNHTTKYGMTDLRATTQQAGVVQIRVGLWILAFFVKSAYRYLKRRLGEVPLDDLIRTTDFFYAAGPGNARKKLDKVPRPSFENVKARWPNWDRIAPAQLVWTRSQGAAWDVGGIDSWLEGDIADETEKAGMGAAVGLVIMAIAWFYFEKGKKK
jgi:soluble lytic murein transglycosylase-like protein